MSADKRRNKRCPNSIVRWSNDCAECSPAPRISSNAEGGDASAGDEVDRTWREHVNQALAVLHTAREPDEAMAAAGDAEMWRNMVEAAIAQHID